MPTSSLSKGNSPQSPFVVSQQEILELGIMQTFARRYSEAAAHQLENIIRKMQNGATIEPGKYVLTDWIVVEVPHVG